MTTQDDMARDDQCRLDWQDLQVWCAKCEEWVREQTRSERMHPERLEDELCPACQEDADLEAEYAAEAEAA